MALTEYSTIAEMRARLVQITTAIISDVAVTAIIAEADSDFIKSDLGNVVNFTTVDALDTVPGWLNKLSRYKTNEICLVTSYSGKRHTEDNSDIKYWMDGYAKTIEDILSGVIPIVDDDGNALGTGTLTYSNHAKDGIEPYFGVDDYGEFKNKTDLATDRPTS